MKDKQIKSCIAAILLLHEDDEQRFEDFGVTLKECLMWVNEQHFDYRDLLIKISQSAQKSTTPYKD